MSWTLKIQAVLGSLNLDVELAGGDAPVALIGPNGSGKSTLLSLIAGAPLASTGQITLDSKTLFDSSAGVFVPPESRRVAYLPQSLALFPHLTALSNVTFGLRFERANRTAKARSDAALAQLRSLGCENLAGSFPAELSGGEQQRVALARTLVKDSALLLLDEPLAALDIVSRRELRGTLTEQLRQTRTKALIVTHDPRDVLALGATIYVLSEGRVIQKGTAKELRANPQTEFVAEFFSDGLG